MMSKDENVDCFKGFWKTTSCSTICCIIFRVMNQYGTDTWVWNASLLAEIFKNYAKVMDIRDPLIYEALVNMDFGKASDPDNANKNVPLVAKYSPRDDPKKTLKIDVFHAFTYITIPVNLLDSRADEDNWIDSAVTKVLKGVRDTMNEEAFRATLERVGLSRRQNYIQKLYDPTKKTNLPKFLAGAIVKAKPVEYLTNHVIQAVSNDIMTHLYNNRLDTAKYPAEPKEETEEDNTATSDNAVDDNDGNTSNAAEEENKGETSDESAADDDDDNEENKNAAAPGEGQE